MFAHSLCANMFSLGLYYNQMMSKHDSSVKEVAGYQLAECIGSGGMGEVYKAYNSSLNRFAAVKILYQKDLAERFKNEAYIQSSINHPNIARLYEFAVCEGKPCIVMEYVEGESLDALLRRKRKLSNDETENIIQQIAKTLDYLHKKGIMHRDIKPQNFKMQVDGTVKMLDFGIAKNKYTPKLTQLGFVVGTLEYSAPEQYQQHPELKSDIWALAVMTYELLTGFLPFEASNPILLKSKIVNGSFTDPKILIPEISVKLLTIIDKGLRVNPSNRISAAEIVSLLSQKKRDTVTNRLNIPKIHFDEWTKQTWFKPVLIGAIALLVLFLLVKSIQQSDSTQGNYPDSLSNVNNNKPPKKDQPDISERKITISTPGIENAELILSDSMHQPLPYDVKGKEGDFFQFTIHAPGYADKKIDVVITSHRTSYEYNLDKINN